MFLVILVMGLAFVSCESGNENIERITPVDYVDPLIDTHNSRWLYFSSASRPFGMVNLSPDTFVKGTWGSGYLYDTTYIRCLSHIHAWQMSGLAVMPMTGSMNGHLGMEAYKSKFSHDREMAKPGYHQVFLDRYQTNVELTSTTRVGFHQYTFPDSTSRYVIFDTGAFLAHSETSSSSVTKVSDQEITGYAVMAPTFRRPKPVKVYFVAQVSQPFVEFGGWKKKELLDGNIQFVSGPDAGAYMKFPEDLKQLKMKVAISYTSLENARNNLTIELPHWDFDRVVQESQSEWNHMLGRIAVEGGSHAQRVKFYTDLWHALLGRRIVSDVNGDYIDNTGAQATIRTVPLDETGEPRFAHHNFDAWWGSHWSLNILWSMVYPEIMDAFCNTMLNMYRDGGLIPRGPSGGNYTYVMIGDPAVSFFAASLNKGINHYDVSLAYEGLRKNAFVGGIRDHSGYENQKPAIGGGMRFYQERGYVPEGIDSVGFHQDGASMTLEYAYQDWCLAQIAKQLGQEEDHAYFLKRSENYKNLWNTKSNFMHPREMDGNWIENFTPVTDAFSARGFCESNSAIYTNYVPQDISGLTRLFGGSDNYINFLNNSFEIAENDWLKSANKIHAANWVDYGNQPGTGMAHIFNKTGAPWLSQKWVRRVKEIYGETSPYGGYHGDEDQGQMGALGVLMAIGLFSVDGSAASDPTYEITSPIFDQVVIKLDQDYYEGDSFIIETEDNSSENQYIQSATLNGQEWNRYWFDHEDFAKGGLLKLQLGPIPNKNWGKE
ncbi:MAG: GH92 family glycosyl hydrolase [Cyclobacteriaceae bacterium]|nr:GH92 family glycosyl hydrolase [Cyclobacteriaceae bacterium HetDA_MAG_MS6]